MNVMSDDDRESRQDVTICVAVFTFLVAATAVSLRLYTRKVIINKLGIDDFCALTALLLVFGCDLAVAYNIKFGLGRHIWAVPEEKIPRYLRTFYVSIVMYNASLMAIKITFLSQYYRIFQRTTKRIVMAVTCTFVVVTCWAISQLLVAIFTCHPVDGYWNKTKGATCIPNHPFWEINAAGNIVTDVCIFVLPIPILERLNLPRRQRHILVGIFSLGLFTVAISLIRIRFLKQYDDFTWENVESSGWSMGELACGLTCACLPTLRPLLMRYAPWLSSRAGTDFGPSGATGPEKDLERGGFRASSSVGGATADTSTTGGAGLLPFPKRHRTRPSDATMIADWPLRPTPPPQPAEKETKHPQASSGLGAPSFFTCGLQRADSGGDASDTILGLDAARDALGMAGRPREDGGGTQPTTPAAVATPAGGGGLSQRSSVDSGARATPRRPSSLQRGGSSRKASQESVRWMQPVVQTEITADGARGGAHQREAGQPADGIRVEHDVYLTKRPAGP